MDKLALAMDRPTMALPSALQPQRWGGGCEKQAGHAEQGGHGRGSILLEKQMIFWLPSNPTCAGGP